MPHEPYMLLIMGAAIIALSVLVPLLVTVYVFLSRFATKEELQALEKRCEAANAKIADDMRGIEVRVTAAVGENRHNNEARFGEIIVKFDDLTKSIQLWVNETARSTGAFEGRQQLMEKVMEKVLAQQPAHD